MKKLIVFVKNPVEGQVKTRLAQAVGHPKATEVYRALLHYTKSIVLPLKDVAIDVFFGNDLPTQHDIWVEPIFNIYLQQGADLGERMAHAFGQQFAAGYDQVVIIGSDCLAITSAHIEAAFAALDHSEVVIGPAHDGGYYLLGMAQYYDFLFRDKSWSQPTLLAETLSSLALNQVKTSHLEPLNDIDTWEDYLRATSKQ